MAKYFFVPILFLIGVLLVPSLAFAADVEFTEDTVLDLSGLPTILYAKATSKCDSLTVSPSTLNVDVLSGDNFTLKTTYDVLGLTPSALVTLTFDTAYFSSGYVNQWTVSSAVTSASASFSVAVAESNADYLVKVDGSNYGYYISDSSGIVSFNYTGGFSLRTFTITRENRPLGVIPIVDVTPPSISNIKVIVADNYARISWQTSEPSISWILYGTTTAYGLEIKTTTSTTSHSLTLTGLSASTTYHYQIKSKDAAGNIGSYTDQTFTTLALGEKPKEVVKPISEMTVEELKAEITRITALITQIQSLLRIAKIEGIPAGFIFKKNLSSGMTDPDVVYLKIVLVNQGCVSGLKNNEYFASKTKEGVKCFCQKYKEEISQFAGYPVSCNGFVGKGIRTKLNQLISR